MGSQLSMSSSEGRQRKICSLCHKTEDCRCEEEPLPRKRIRCEEETDKDSLSSLERNVVNNSSILDVSHESDEKEEIDSEDSRTLEILNEIENPNQTADQLPEKANENEEVENTLQVSFEIPKKEDSLPKLQELQMEGQSLNEGASFEESNSEIFLPQNILSSEESTPRDCVSKECTTKLRRYKTKCAKQNRENKKQKEELKKCWAENQKLKDLIDTLKEKNAQETIKQKYAQKDQEIEDRFRKEMGTQQLELKQTLATQLQEITSLKETVSLLQKNNEAKDFEMDLLKKEVETKENELGKKEREFENKRNELESKRAELESKRAELESKRAELDRKGREVDTKGFEVDVKGFELEKKKRELEKKGLELERKETELMKREIEGAKQAALPRRRVQFKPDVEVVDLT